MKPFSAMYFVRENRTRCFLLIFMLFLGYVAYLGGLYVTNPRDNWELPVAYYRRMVRVNDTAGDKENFSHFFLRGGGERQGDCDKNWLIQCV